MHDGPSFFGYFAGTKWGSPSEPHLRRLMRHVTQNRDEARAKGQAARQYLLKVWAQAAAQPLDPAVLGVGLWAKPRCAVHDVMTW